MIRFFTYFVKSFNKYCSVYWLNLGATHVLMFCVLTFFSGPFKYDLEYYLFDVSVIGKNHKRAMILRSRTVPEQNSVEFFMFGMPVHYMKDYDPEVELQKLQGNYTLPHGKINSAGYNIRTTVFLYLGLLVRILYCKELVNLIMRMLKYSKYTHPEISTSVKILLIVLKYLCSKYYVE